MVLENANGTGYQLVVLTGVREEGRSGQGSRSGSSSQLGRLFRSHVARKTLEVVA
jgi:hypothetical protein